MTTLWFCLVAFMLAVYVMLDGFDLGAGILHLGIAHSDQERRAVISSIGPVWDGNEVWLLATGGTLYFAFPALYASGFSGFYLPLMIVLWLLILRGVAIELRNYVPGSIWAPFWDVMFSLSSALLAIFFGAALGNVVRGVPLTASGFFFEPLWTNFRLGPPTGILDWYTILAGLTAYFALAQHGALWVALKTNGAVSHRARICARISWWMGMPLTGIITYCSFRIQPQISANFAAHPWGYIFPALALAGLAGVLWSVTGTTSPTAELRGFLSSCAYLAGMLTSAAFGVYPLVLPARGNLAYGLTIENASAGEYGLKIGLIWWTLGMVLVTGYFVFVYRHFAGKVPSSEHQAGTEREGY
jgi:cytochrome bd ubiquinol oxidase subunit II